MRLTQKDEFVLRDILRGVLGYFPKVRLGCWLIQGRKRIGEYTSRTTDSDQSMPYVRHKVLAPAIRCHFGKPVGYDFMMLVTVRFPSQE